MTLLNNFSQQSVNLITMKIQIRFAILAVALLVGVNVFAQNTQTLKIGYTNADVILSSLPDAEKISKELEVFEKQLEDQYKSSETEIRQKIAVFEKEAPNLLPVVLEKKRNEILRLQQELQDFRQTAENEMQKKQMMLLEPVYTKIQEAIDKVAKAEGYTFILSSEASGFPILLYADESNDITEKVVKELGGKLATSEAKTETKTEVKTETKTTDNKTPIKK